MISPIQHSLNPEQMACYKVEPYVVAADVYAVAPHVGRGGWTWYTGSAGWMYRLMLESLLGLQVQDGILRLQPCLPSDWARYAIHFHYHATIYHITVLQQHAGMAQRQAAYVRLDGVLQSEGQIALQNDEREHQVEWMLA